MSNPATQFKKGEVHNPKGRPKAEWTMSGLLREALEEQDENGTPYKLIINRKLRELAKKGDMIAIKEINNRMDGMPKQGVEFDGSMTIEIVRKQNESTG